MGRWKWERGRRVVSFCDLHFILEQVFDSGLYAARQNPGATIPGSPPRRSAIACRRLSLLEGGGLDAIWLCSGQSTMASPASALLSDPANNAPLF